jgi:uncharacterized Ntn-hydrolase superfamily protein
MTREAELTTFSLAARCARTGMLGVVVATAMPAVGANCPWLAPGAGAIATQAWVNPYLGVDGLSFLKAGHTAQETLDHVLFADPRRESRQLGVVDTAGRSAAFTGADCRAWAGHRTGPDHAAQGNMLTGPEVVAALANSFTATSALDLPERLMRALEAAAAQGGDLRGRQSAALKVITTEDYPYLDLRVDEHPDPVTELRRVYTVARSHLEPFVRMFPTRADPAGTYDHATWTRVGLPPAAR